MRLENRTALVTGASQGIGKSIALAMAREGADVVVTARSEDRLKALAQEIESLGVKALAAPADLGIESDIKRVADQAIEKFGAVDILVNNASIIQPSVPVVDFEPDMWRDILNVNLTGTFLITKFLLPKMIERGYGKIINISSIGGRKGGRGRGAYRVTKAGQISFTETLAAEVKEHGIDVNAILPGGIDTEGYREAFNTRGREDNPKLGSPENIANVAVFLASAESAAITGAAIDAFGNTNPLFA